MHGALCVGVWGGTCARAEEGRGCCSPVLPAHEARAGWTAACSAATGPRSTAPSSVQMSTSAPSARCEEAAAGNRASGVRTGDVRDAVMLLLDILKFPALDMSVAQSVSYTFRRIRPK